MYFNLLTVYFQMIFIVPLHIECKNHWAVHFHSPNLILCAIIVIDFTSTYTINPKINCFKQWIIEKKMHLSIFCFYLYNYSSLLCVTLNFHLELFFFCWKKKNKEMLKKAFNISCRADLLTMNSISFYWHKIIIISNFEWYFYWIKKVILGRFSPPTPSLAHERCLPMAFWLAWFLSRDLLSLIFSSSIHNMSFLIWLLLRFLFITGFQKFVYNMPWCGFSGIYSTWDLSSFLDLWVYPFQ